MRKEYDLQNGRPNPYAKRLGTVGRDQLIERFLKSEHLVRLDEEVAKAFPSPEALKDALRLVMQLRELKPRPTRKAKTARGPASRPKRSRDK
jgi:hypothetical protein